MKSNPFPIRLCSLSFALPMWLTFLAVSICSNPALAQSDSLACELVTNADEKATGSLLKITADNVVIQTSGNATDEPEEFSLDSVASISFGNTLLSAETNPTTTNTADGSPDRTTFQSVQLVDGSRLQTTSAILDQREFSMTLGCGLTCKTNVRDIKPVLLRPLDGGLTEESWNEAVDEAAQSADGLIVSRNGKLNTIEGVIAGINNDTVTFTVDDQTREIKLERLQGLFFYHPTGRQFDAPVCQLKLIDDSVIAVRKANIEDGNIDVTSVCGAEFRLQSSVIASFDFASGRDIFLSNLEPLSNDWAPLIASSTIVEKLKSFRKARLGESSDGSPLRLSVYENGLASLGTTKDFSTGIAISGGGKVSFALNRQFKNLSGLVGFDPAANLGGVVSFVIQVDGVTKFQQRLVNADRENPVAIDVDVSDGKRLLIKVEYEDGRSVGDQIHFVDAKLSR